MNDGIIIALLIGVVLGASGIYAWYLKMERIQRFIDSSGIVENYKTLKIERDELAKEIKILSADNKIMRKAILSFAKGEKNRKDMKIELDQMRNFQTWQFGRLFEILSKNGVKLSDEEWNELTPSN